MEGRGGERRDGHFPTDFELTTGMMVQLMPLLPTVC